VICSIILFYVNNNGYRYTDLCDGPVLGPRHRCGGHRPQPTVIWYYLSIFVHFATTLLMMMLSLDPQLNITHSTSVRYVGDTARTTGACGLRRGENVKTTVRSFGDFGRRACARVRPISPLHRHRSSSTRTGERIFFIIIIIIKKPTRTRRPIA